MECQYCHLNTRKAYCSECIQQKLKRSQQEESVVIKERDQVLNKANAFIQKTSLIRVLLAEKSKSLKELEYLKEQQKMVSKRCLAKSKRIDELKKQIQTTERIQTASLERRDIQISNEVRCKNQLKMKLKTWQRNHKKVVVQRRHLMEDIKSFFDISKNEQGDVSICGQTLLTTLIEIPEYPAEVLNAATHIVTQILNLIINYLGIELPFYISRKGLHYRIGLAKSNTTNSVRKKSRMYLFISEGEKNYQKFVNGMAMLNYNIAYLCHTQAIEIPLNHQVTHTMQNLISCLDTPLPPDLGIHSHALRFHGRRGLDFPMDFKQVLQLTKQCYKYNPPPDDIEEKISEMDLNDHYFSKNHSKQQQADDSNDDDDDELYSDSDDDDDSDEKTKDDYMQNENWNLVDVMTSFGSEGLVEENSGGGESIFQLGASMIPGVMNMMGSGGNSQQSPIVNYLYRRGARR